MAVTERPDAARTNPAATGSSSDPRGFRPTSRRRARIAAGVVLAAVAIGGNVLVYTSMDDTTEVVQLVNNVRAGEIIESDDLRLVSVELDPTVPVVEAGDISLVANQYATVYLAAGSLIAPQLVQPDPLVTAGTAVVAVEVAPVVVPVGVRERSQVQLVIPPSSNDETVTFIDGRVVGRQDDIDSISGNFSLSVEVAPADAPALAAADDVRVVLLDPGVDPVREGDDG